MAKIRDYECSICMLLMIEPVTLPCKHELCYKCFTSHLAKTNQCCPFCRVRIATWMRKEMRMNRVVNKEKWLLIQKLFPKQVKCVMEGKELVSDDEEPESQVISEAGSLGKEYFEQMQKIETERSKAKQEEEAASLALIQKLVESEAELKILPAKNNASTLPDQRVYSTTDVERLKQIAEEEAASLQLIQTLQEEERRALAEQRRQEIKDRLFAQRVLSSASIVDDSVTVSDAAEISLESSGPTSSSSSESCYSGIKSLPCSGPSSSADAVTASSVSTPIAKSNPAINSTEAVIKRKPTQLTRWLNRASTCPESALGAASCSDFKSSSDTDLMLTVSGEASAVLLNSVAASSSAAEAASPVTLQNDAVKGMDDFKVLNELDSLEGMNKFPLANNASVTVLPASQNLLDSNRSSSFFSSSKGSAVTAIPTVDSSAIETASELHAIFSAMSDRLGSLFESAVNTGNNGPPDNAVKASTSTNTAMVKHRRQSPRIKTLGKKSLKSTTVNDLLQVDVESRGELPPLKKRAKCLFGSGPTGAEITPVAVPVLERNAFNSDAEWSAHVLEQDHALAVLLQQQLRRKVPKQKDRKSVV